MKICHHEISINITVKLHAPRQLYKNVNTKTTEIGNVNALQNAAISRDGPLPSSKK